MGALRKLYNLAYLRREAWLPRDELIKRQNARLERIVRFAYEHVPFYREAYRGCGIERHPIRNKRDLERLPVVRKTDIQERPHDFLAVGTDTKACIEMHTSGSTGRPLRIFYGEKDDDYSKINNLRSFIEVGYRRSDTFVTIADPEWTRLRYHPSSSSQLQRKLNFFFPRDVNMRLTPGETLDAILRIGRCDVLYGYASNLFLVAKEVRTRGETRLQPRIVVSNGETITQPMRSFINETFRTELFDFYTTEESKRIAWECEAHRGYHIDVESVVIELVKHDRQVESGDSGAVVITNLFNYTMPLIRYWQGDVAVESDAPCGCGRGLPLLKSLEGRTDSFVVNRSGEMFSPQTFWSIFRHYDSVAQFQIRQHAPGELDVHYLAKNEEACGRDLMEIRGKITEFMGSETQINFKPGALSEQGKRKAVFSSLNHALF
jgi:phenylacetate-CoA ligase